MAEEWIWEEKYRPQKVRDVVLPKELKQVFQNFVDAKSIPNMILSGGPGMGKTTMARALCDELGYEYMFINGSDERNIDILRGKIRQFASTVSFYDTGMKVVILDEADYLNPNSTQPALRGFITEFSKTCRFIFTCNYKDKLIQPLHSRCSVYDFNIPKKQLAGLAGQFFKRLKEILDAEEVEYIDEPLVEMVKKFAPDWRRILNECQKYSIGGKIDEGILVNVTEKNYDELFLHLKGKEFKKVRQWVVNNLDVDTTVVLRGIYDRMYDKIETKSIPQLVLILGEYQYKAAFVADAEINLMACFTEIMSQVEFK